MRDLKIPGVSLAVIENYRIKWARGYGELEAGTQRAILSTHLHDLASLSKGLAALGIMTLVEDPGVPLALDSTVQEVADLLPNASHINNWLFFGFLLAGSQPTDLMTLQQLLSHSASLRPHSSTSFGLGEPTPSTAQLLLGYTCSGGDCAYGGGDLVWYSVPG